MIRTILIISYYKIMISTSFYVSAYIDTYVCTLTRIAVKVICVLDKLAMESDETTGRLETMLAVGINVGADIEGDRDHYFIV